MKHASSYVFLIIIILLLLVISWRISENPPGGIATLLPVETTRPPNEIPTEMPVVTVTPTDTNTPEPTLTPTPAGDGEITVIGYSVEGRPLEVYRFGSGEHNYLIIAGIHGGYEWNTVQLADELMEKIKSREILIPEDKTLFILRNLNPDGYEKDKGPDGRANANGVDLNRNWDADWQANWWGSECWNLRFITAGSEPGSEPETQAAAKFILENNIEALISYHSAGLGIFPGGWPDDADSYNLAYRLSLVSPYSYPPIETACDFTGQLANWASLHGITAVDIELSTHADTDLWYNMQIIETFLK